MCARGGWAEAEGEELKQSPPGAPKFKNFQKEVADMSSA